MKSKEVIDRLKKVLSPVFILDYKMNHITETILKHEVKVGDSWLDVGCGTKPFEYLFKNAYCYVGIDVEKSGRSIEMKRADKFFDGHSIPFEGDVFDGILCTQVLEHAIDAEQLTSECYRVLKPGGTFVLSVPFLFREHEQPYDFQRFTSFGIEQLLLRHNFNCKQVHKCLSGIETIATLLSVYMSNNIGVRNRYLGYFVLLLLCLPIQVVSIILSRGLPDNRDLFLTLVAVGQKRYRDEPAQWSNQLNRYDSHFPNI